jgi:Zn-dependent M28 family amino/carboxypeptidase
VEGSGDEVVVIGAHIDHLGTDAITGEIYNGGDDNASGTVVMMELARLLATCGEVPERTVLFAAFNAEESGLIGSCFYVGEPSYPHEDTVAAISVDMVGAGDGGGLNLFGALMEEYLWLAQLMDAAAAEQGLPYDTFANVPVLASDHVCFITQEITAVMAQTTGPHEHYHTPDDTPANNSPDNLAAAAHLMWAALEPLAMGTEAPYLEGEYDPLGATAAPAGPPDLRPELR